MKVTKIGFVSGGFYAEIFPVNCYLVEEESELTLVDAALPFSVKGILKAAESIGKPITRIVLTHAHGDHIGALDGLKKFCRRRRCIFREEMPSCWRAARNWKPENRISRLKETFQSRCRRSRMYC